MNQRACFVTASVSYKKRSSPEFSIEERCCCKRFWYARVHERVKLLDENHAHTLAWWSWRICRRRRSRKEEGRAQYGAAMDWSETTIVQAANGNFLTNWRAAKTSILLLPSPCVAKFDHHRRDCFIELKLIKLIFSVISASHGCRS